VTEWFGVAAGAFEGPDIVEVAVVAEAAEIAGGVAVIDYHRSWQPMPG
jgi:hypothetical protein